MADSSCVSVRILLVLLMLDSVYCRVQIEYAGSNVLLNCSYSTTSNVNVYWRYKGAHNLVDIIDGEMDFSDQDQRYRDRIDTFRKLYAEGNFSVVLKNVNLNDSGPYNCDIPRVKYQRQLQLAVTVRPTEGPTPAKSKGDSVSVREHSYCSLLSIMLSLTLALRN